MSVSTVPRTFVEDFKLYPFSVLTSERLNALGISRRVYSVFSVSITLPSGFTHICIVKSLPKSFFTSFLLRLSLMPWPPWPLNRRERKLLTLAPLLLLGRMVTCTPFTAVPEPNDTRPLTTPRAMQKPSTVAVLLCSIVVTVLLLSLGSGLVTLSVRITRYSLNEPGWAVWSS